MEEERFLEALVGGRCARAYFAVAGCECVGVVSSHTNDLSVY